MQRTSISKAEWGEKLKQHIAKRRETSPIPPRPSLTPEQEYQCRILGGNLIQWLERWGPRLIQERNIVAWKDGTDKEPLVIVATDIPGLVAANEILRGRMDRVLYCLKPELRDFEATCPDKDFLVHCEFAIHFEKLDKAEVDRLREKFNLPPETRVMVQAESSILGPLFARGCRHLWDFSGSEPELVEEAFETWMS